MFCNKCGNPIPDGNKFCSKCGAPINANLVNEQQFTNNAQPVEQINTQPAYQQPVQPQPAMQMPNQQPIYNQPVYPNQAMPYNMAPVNAPKKKHTGLIVALIVLILAAIAACLILFVFKPGSNDSPMGVAKKCMKAFINDDYKGVENCHHSDLENLGDDSYDYLEIFSEGQAEGGKITYEFHDYQKLTKYQLDELKENVEAYCGHYSNDITEAGIVDCDYTMKGSESWDDSETLYFLVVKYKGKWYVYFVEDDYIGF